jgi:F-type H+-transporting ATPase subunit epsilon
MKTINFSIISPEKQFYSGAVTSILTESQNGYIEVLPDHMPLIVVLRPGITTFKQEDGKELEAFTSDGLMVIKKGEVNILCDSCEWPENIDLTRAQVAKTRAEERLKKATDIDKLRAEIAFKKAVARIKIKSK